LLDSETVNSWTLAYCIFFLLSIRRDVAQVAERAKLHADVLGPKKSPVGADRAGLSEKNSSSSTNDGIDSYFVSNDSQFCPLNVVKVSKLNNS
jgi:hypothetical protein